MAKDENSGNYVVTAYDYVRGAEEKKNENSATTFTAGQTSEEEEARAVASNNHSQDKDTNNIQNEQSQSAQTGDEVVLTSLLESVEERKRAKASELSEQGISDARLLDLLDEQAVAEDAYLRALDKYGIKHTTRLTGNVTGNRFMSSVVNAVKKLTVEEAREVLITIR